MESVDIQNEEKNLKDSETFSLVSSFSNKEKGYQYGLDVIRLLAMYLVLSVHATSFHYYLDIQPNTFILFICGLHRYISFSCCPLFMILTGYLNKEKKPILSYYSKIISIVFEYLLCSSIVITFRYKYYEKNLKSTQIIDGFFKFSNAPYSWYINMYIGLFLISPFLNILYNNLNSSKNKYSLIVVSIILFSLPGTYYRFSWDFWQGAYPIMYYFIGCFIRDYQPKLKKTYLLIWIVVVDITQMLIKKYSTKLYAESFHNFGCVLISSTIFLIFYNFKAKRKNCFLKVLRKISDISLSFFLLAYIFDLFFELNLFKKKNLDNFMKRLPYLFITVHANSVLSIIMGLFTHNITLLVIKTLHYLYDKLNEMYKTHDDENNTI